MPILFHTVLVAAHLVAVAVGLGAALLADWVSLRLLSAAVVRRSAASRLRDLSHAVTAGIVLLWATGAVLVWFDAAANPAFLANQKVWAKVVVVAALTLNAVLLHAVVLPLVEAQKGRALFDGVAWGTRLSCTFAASVSFISWLFALVLGVAKELNGVVTLGQVLVVYGAVLGAAWAGATVVASLVRPGMRRAPPSVHARAQAHAWPAN